MGNGLKTALQTGNRAEAWFEIRYGSNGDKLGGIAKRRYYESELFGLYDNPSSVTADEAKQAYRMFQLHRADILKYENTYSAQIAAANSAGGYNLTGAAAVDTLTQALTPARDALFADLVAKYPVGMAGLSASDFDPANIYLDPIQSSVVLLEGHSAFLNSAVDPLTGLETFYTRDILIGEDGNDYLMGGTGDDVLIGGTGLDYYYWRTGDGNDRIIDEDKQGIIVINDGAQDLYAAGAFKETTPGSNIWKSLDGKITLTHNSPWKLVTADGSEIQLGDFADGDFGIHLVEETTPATVLTGTALANYLEAASGGQRVEGLAGADMIHGFAGIDHLLGGDGGDWIVGNGGADHIEGGLGNDYITGIGANSLADGGDGNDILSASASDWIVIQTPNSPISADVFWADAASVLFNPGYSVYTDSNGDPTVDYGAFPVNASYSGASSLGGGWTYQFTVANGQWDAKYFHPQTAPNGMQPASYWEQRLQGLAAFTESVYLQGGAGDDLLIGNNGADVLDGGTGGDTLFGSGGDNVLDGGAGADNLVGDVGHDVLIGGVGTDSLFGGAGDDILDGGDGNDQLNGDGILKPGFYQTLAETRNGNDVLDGGAGDDQLIGDGRDDGLFGGTGKDKLWGDDATEAELSGTYYSSSNVLAKGWMANETAWKEAA